MRFGGAEEKTWRFLGSACVCYLYHGRKWSCPEPELWARFRDDAGSSCLCEHRGPPVLQGHYHNIIIRGNISNWRKGCEDSIQPEAAVGGDSPVPARGCPGAKWCSECTPAVQRSVDLQSKIESCKGQKRFFSVWFWSYFSLCFGAGGGSLGSRLGWPRAGSLKLVMLHRAERSPASVRGEGERMLHSIHPRTCGSADACPSIPRCKAVLRKGGGI